MEMEVEEGGEVRCHLLVVKGVRYLLSVVVFLRDSAMYYIGVLLTITYSYVISYCISRAYKGMASRDFFVNRVPT